MVIRRAEIIKQRNNKPEFSRHSFNHVSSNFILHKEEKKVFNNTDYPSIQL